MRDTRRLTLMAVLLATALAFAAVVPAGAEDKLVNVNTASAAELASVKGIGQAKAEAIVAYREKNGPFKSMEELDNVKGIGGKLLNTLRSQVTVGATASAAAPAGSKR